jgi:hypothetical protein
MIATTLAALLLVACTTACTDQAARNAASGPIEDGVKITQFYVSPLRIGPGEKALLCYGTESAASAEIVPKVDSEVYPAVSRCVQVAPSRTTSYQLTAVSKGGQRASASVLLQVGGSASGLTAAKATFTDLSVTATRIKAGQVVGFCFQATGAVRVEGAPGQFQKGGNPAGDCLTDQPRAATTYRITLRDASGASRSETVRVEVEP